MAGNEFDRAELNALGRALNNLEPFRELRRDMPLQYVYSFLLVASRPGRTVLDYAKMAGVSHSVMSRHLLDIGPRARDMTEGFGLVEFYTEPNDMRAHYYRLTVKGKRIATQIIRNMGAH